MCEYVIVSVMNYITNILQKVSDTLFGNGENITGFQRNAFHIFILKELFEKFFGNHYPIEIIKLIALTTYEPIKMSTGSIHSALLCDDLYVWGSNVVGELGLGDRINQLSPQRHPLKNVIEINCGSCHTIAQTLSEIYVWGSNASGQLGLGDFCDRTTPTKLVLRGIPEGLIPTGKIICGSYHTFYLTKGIVYAWGRNSDGQLGLGYVTNSSISKKLGLTHIQSISCGESYTCALTTTGQIYSWGLNNWGQLGLADTKDRCIPHKILLDDVEQICCGKNHTLALTKFADVYVWGRNEYEKLGLSGYYGRITPHKLDFTDKFAIKSICCGKNHSMILTKDGTVWSWGNNYFGQLGTGRASVNVPDVCPILHVKSVCCGSSSNHVMVLTKCEKIYVWGRNKYGQLGLGDNEDRSEPSELKFQF